MKDRKGERARQCALAPSGGYGHEAASQRCEETLRRARRQSKWMRKSMVDESKMNLNVLEGHTLIPK